MIQRSKGTISLVHQPFGLKHLFIKYKTHLDLDSILLVILFASSFKCIDFVYVSVDFNYLQEDYNFDLFVQQQCQGPVFFILLLYVSLYWGWEWGHWLKKRVSVKC